MFPRNESFLRFTADYKGSYVPAMESTCCLTYSFVLCSVYEMLYCVKCLVFSFLSFARVRACVRAQMNREPGESPVCAHPGHRLNAQSPVCAHPGRRLNAQSPAICAHPGRRLNAQSPICAHPGRRLNAQSPACAHPGRRLNAQSPICAHPGRRLNALSPMCALFTTQLDYLDSFF